MTRTLKALILGDIVGQPGCRALFVGLPDLARRLEADLVVANGENAADGFGLTPEIAERMRTCGVHVITSGNQVKIVPSATPQRLISNHSGLTPR